MKVICTNCSTQMRCEHAVNVVEHSDFGPYKLWRADVYKCSICEREVVTAFGDHPYAEHFHPNFDDVLASVRASGEAIYHF